MIYLIGAVLVLLIIALVLVFRPPKSKPYNDSSQKEKTVADAVPSDEQLDLDIGYGGEKTAGPEEELDLVLDEQLEDFTEDAAVSVEEPYLVPEEEGDDDLTEEKGHDEYDEDIPFIDEGEGAYARKGDSDVAPALADVPDGYEQIEEDETPAELAERLEFFLGTGDEETEAAEEEAGEVAPDRAEDRGATDHEEEAADRAVEAGEAAGAEPLAGPDEYGGFLQDQVERLHSEMNRALANRETKNVAKLGVALENLRARQIDLQDAFQRQQMLLDALEKTLNEVKEVLPGFRQEAMQAGLCRGDFEVVRTLLGDSVDQLEGSPQLCAKMLYQFGRIEEERGALDSAAEMYTRALSLDGENPDSLYAAGCMARISGETENAVALLEKRVNLGRDKDEESVDLARAEHKLAGALILEDEKDRAEQLLLHARETMEKALGDDHPDLGLVLQDLAVLYDGSGRYEQAEPLYLQAIEVTEKGLGKESPRLASMLNRLAGLYEEIEKEDKTESLYIRALDMKKMVLGENHPDVGTILGHLANLRKKQGRFDEAESMFKESLAIAEVALGRDHPNLAVVLNDLAELYSETGNEEQAAHYQERAFALFGLPGMGDGFVEMDKDSDFNIDDDKNQTVAGN